MQESEIQHNQNTADSKADLFTTILTKLQLYNDKLIADCAAL